MRRLYRIEVRYVAYAYCETEDAAEDCADRMLDDVLGVTRVRPVWPKGEHPARHYDADSPVYTDGPEEVTLGDVWPGEPL